MTTPHTNPFVLPGMGQSGDAAGNPLLASMEMMRNAWSGLTGPGGLAQSLPMSPPMNLEDLERRISELRSIESWLRMNLSMLSSTIQGMEVQRSTIATLRSFVSSVSSMEGFGSGEGVASPLEIVLGLKPAPKGGVPPQNDAKAASSAPPSSGGYSGAGQPGAGQPGAGQPGAGQSGSGQQAGQYDTGHPGSGYPGAGHPGSDAASAAAPSTSTSGAGQAARADRAASGSAANPPASAAGSSPSNPSFMNPFAGAPFAGNPFAGNAFAGGAGSAATPPENAGADSASPVDSAAHMAQAASQAWWDMLQQQFNQIASATTASMPTPTAPASDTETGAAHSGAKAGKSGFDPDLPSSAATPKASASAPAAASVPAKAGAKKPVGLARAPTGSAGKATPATASKTASKAAAKTVSKAPGKTKAPLPPTSKS